MAERRRSARISSKSSASSSIAKEVDHSTRSIETDEHTAIDHDNDDSNSELESESESEEDDNEDDEDYIESSKKKGSARATTNKRKRTNNNGIRSTNKRTKTVPTSRSSVLSSTSAKKDQETYLELIKDFEPTELFEILATSEDVSIVELLTSWLETYTENRDKFLKEFINLVLNCCGAVATVEDHDVHSNDSSNETIGEVQLMFQRQKIHEFHLLVSKEHKKKSKYKPLYNNFVEFMSKLLDVANDLQLLFIESSPINKNDETNSENNENTEITMGPLVLDLLTWLSSFSVSKVRSFRYISTLSLYLFQDYLTNYIMILDKNYLSKLSKQLAVEEKKKRPNKKTLEKLNLTIMEIQGNKTVTESIIDNIVKLCFIHRFKDVDESIRSESMVHLAIWTENFPEYFLKVTFLKYFGWLLSDESSSVRIEVLKVLPKLVVDDRGKPTDNSFIRQFFERFKQRILEIALKDVDLEVRIQSINVLTGISSLDYLEDSEMLLILSTIFSNHDIKVSSTSKNSRFLASVAKFFARITNEKCQEFMNDNNLPKTIDNMSIDSTIKIGIFIRLLSNSFVSHLEMIKSGVEPREKIHILFQAAEFLFPYFGSQIENICQLLINDEISNDIAKQLSTKENDDQEEEANDDLDITPLFPTDSNSIVLYVTVLNGLTQGGISSKNSTKFHISDIIIPNYEKLMLNLPLQSIDILAPILEIFTLFTFEDWIHAGYEKTVSKVTEAIMKMFKESNLVCSDADMKYQSFSKVFQHIKKFELKELDELCVNELTYLKLQLENFLKDKMEKNEIGSPENFNETIVDLYEVYVNKLVLLGKGYTLEFDESLIKLFFKNYMSHMPSMLDSLDIETIELMDFKLLVLLVTWQLQKWEDIFENLDPTSSQFNNTSTLKTSMNTIILIIESLNKIMINLPASTESTMTAIYLLNRSLSNSTIDIVVAVRVFELKLPDSNPWKETLKNKLPYYLHTDVSNTFMEVYLYLESCAVNVNESGIHLDRLAEEDVNLNELPKEELFGGNYERELLLFTIKLKGLIKLELLRGDIVSRIALNKDHLSPLYTKVIDDTIFKTSTTEASSTKRSIATVNTRERDLEYNGIERNNTEMEEQDRLDPIEDSSQPTQDDEPMVTNRRYEGLEPIEEQSQELSQEVSPQPFRSISENLSGIGGTADSRSNNIEDSDA
ncbi:cohesin subunit IRR1 NDAI_0G01970 [Naumovozyma dairenensis CBS 421]|uniref:SCD domain-containing protein n=1 Tax=Naumovozyma dairenensis (strain ATCC 10597 / BCRC 20456 / CBS 421 / NBRC 0211 / NRRL Y-12639) TaxID=1071378 RepID=G0WDW1_NAUDC|nr:hypothetical protein NDAI_0G01970 [Naumovozyma dairenensis CBS 421]CCD25972.2 hypothetical protein NDAI_0G01970 [Naumovozyma dairenensis CBS 421]